MLEAIGLAALPPGQSARNALRRNANSIAAIYSLVGTAALNGIDPEAYLRYVTERIGEHPFNRVG